MFLSHIERYSIKFAAGPGYDAVVIGAIRCHKDLVSSSAALSEVFSGRCVGLKVGVEQARRLAAKQRSEIGRKVAMRRWPKGAGTPEEQRYVSC